MSISKFFTIYWTLYFPVCIAFYHQINFDWSDEILTLILIIYGIANGVFTWRVNSKPMKEVMIYLSLMTFYVIYSLIMAVNVSDSVWNDLQQQIRPYAVFYTTWMLHPQFTKKQKKWLLMLMIGTLFAYIPTLKAGVHDAPVGQMALCCGMAFYLFRPETRRNIYIAIVIAGIGIIGGKAKFVGEMVAFVAFTLFLKGRINWKSQKIILQTSALTIIILASTWHQFDAYFVSGWDDKDNKRARPELYRTGTRMLADYFPFGSGLGTFCCAASSRYYSPIYSKYGLDKIWGLGAYTGGFHQDAYYPNLAQYGIVGLVFFIAFWRRRVMQVNRLPDSRFYKMGLMCVMALLLECVADQSYLSGKGMGYWMILALCIASADFRKSASARHN